MSRTFSHRLPASSVCVIQALDGHGRRHELATPPLEGPTACRLARRAAALLGTLGEPDRWREGRVDVVRAEDNHLMAVIRVPARGRRP